MTSRFKLTMTEGQKDALFGHLFPGDGDEHGAVLTAGVSQTENGLRLLVREVIPAIDGVDYLPGQRGYRMLTGEFVAAKIRHCRDERLAYLAVHNHGGTTSVGFSAPDLASHERGYPALLDIARGQPVGALVCAHEAVAGDLWLPGGNRLPLQSARVVGANLEDLYPELPRRPEGVDETYDRQARMFGDAGQARLCGLRVGVVGAGGVGSLLVEFLARLGIGTIVAVDPDRIEVSNLSRIVGATRFDARSWMTKDGRPEWMRSLGRQWSARKIDIMRRLVRRASQQTRFEGIFGNFAGADVAARFRDCDYMFLAADSFRARLVFNALVNQYLIPGAQIGAKVPVDATSGEVGQVYAVSRPARPGAGCLWCNGLIPPARLQSECATEEERRAQQYVEDATVVAPSVITLNAAASALAVNDFLFEVAGLRLNEGIDYMRVLPRRRRLMLDEPRQDASCNECGSGSASRFARGDGVGMPVTSEAISAAAEP